MLVISLLLIDLTLQVEEYKEVNKRYYGIPDYFESQKMIEIAAQRENGKFNQKLRKSKEDMRLILFQNGFVEIGQFPSLFIKFNQFLFLKFFISFFTLLIVSYRFILFCMFLFFLYFRCNLFLIFIVFIMAIGKAGFDCCLFDAVGIL